MVYECRERWALRNTILSIIAEATVNSVITRLCIVVYYMTVQDSTAIILLTERMILILSTTGFHKSKLLFPINDSQ